MKEKRFSDGEPDPESGISLIDSCVKFCNVIVAGNDSAAALKYDEENMFAPMIVMLEKDAAAFALVRAAERLSVPVIKNVSLMKNLSSYGKSGETIPEATYRDVSLALARLDAGGFHRPSRAFGKSRQGIPIKIPRPLSIEMGASLFALTGEGPGREKLLGEPLSVMRKKLIRLLGIGIPPFRVAHNPRLKTDEYRLLFKGLEAGRGRLELGWYMGEAAAHGDDVSRAAVPDIMNDPENILAAARASAQALLCRAGEILKQRAPELLGRDEVEAILDAAEEKYPVVTGEVKGLLSLGIIREILMSLVSEQVSIRHIAVILETLADWGSFGPAPNDLIVDQIRQSLKRQICLEYADDRLTLRVLTLEPKLEKKFAERSSSGVLSLGTDQGAADPWPEDPADPISLAVKRMEERGFPPVILCSPKARSPVKEATRRKFPDLAVLSYMEIPSDIRVEPVGEISLEENARLPGVGNEP